MSTRFAGIKNKRAVAIGLILFVTGSVSGFVVARLTAAEGIAEGSGLRCLRAKGYTLVSPLLLCDAADPDTTPSLKYLHESLTDIIEQGKAAGDISSASIYVRDFSTGDQVVVNGEEKYFPASLKKLPLMIQMYKMDQDGSNILSVKGILQGNQDLNAGVEIQPSRAPEYGKEYSIDQLIEYMIKYSDNISFNMLLGVVRNEQMAKLYDQLNITYPADQLSPEDSINVRQMANFFRLLRNATYLNAEYSERALQLLSSTEYADGIVAGVPAGTQVAHKFGILTNSTSGEAFRELHDCGIVYGPRSPYLICVMTKSKSNLTKLQGIIEHLSATVYEDAKDGLGK